MGGITGFSSLMDGYMRLDDSGIGPPPLHVLEQPIGKCSEKSIVSIGKVDSETNKQWLLINVAQESQIFSVQVFLISVRCKDK